MQPKNKKMKTESKQTIITIDGPGGSGKSTIATTLAKRLGFCHLNSGMIYRGFAYLTSQDFGVSHKKPPANFNPEWLSIFEKLRVKVSNSETMTVFENNKELNSSALNSTEVSNLVSYLSGFKQVRTKILEIQRNLATHYNLVADGRDCGTEVFPNATAKFYLDADLKVRAERILPRLQKTNPTITISEVINNLRNRDEQDLKRKNSPLQQAHDATLIDTTHLSVEETIELIISKIQH